MENRITDLSEQIDKYLSELQDKYDDIMEQARRATTFLAQQIDKLEAFIADYSFEDEAKEIHFFKQTNPGFYSKYIYYHHITHLEGIRRPGGSPSLQEKLLQEELDRIDRFFRQHFSFITYYNNK